MNTVYFVLGGFAAWSGLCVWVGWRLGAGDRAVLEDDLEDEQRDHDAEIKELKRKIAANAELLAAYRGSFDSAVTGDRVLYDADAHSPEAAGPPPGQDAPAPPA